jgi:ppGpp synthetase/RelA/SpoT-type nucleotidyltranferase
MPSDDLSGSQLEKLGDRLRAGPLTLADLLQLRRFLETLEPFAEGTFAKIRDLDAEAAGLRSAQITRRNVKTIRSILAKLRRQSTTLRQIQDLVGCRLVVHDIVDQNEWLTALSSIFTVAQIVDRRPSPQHGYRAVHFIVRDGALRFEVQLRTVLQDRWANIVEKLDDRLGTQLKYGSGNKAILDGLQELATGITRFELIEESCRVKLRPTPARPTKLVLSLRLPEDVLLWSSTELASGTIAGLGASDDSVSDQILIRGEDTEDAPVGMPGDERYPAGLYYRIEFQGGEAVEGKYARMLWDAGDLYDEVAGLVAWLEEYLT